ncbi:MAG: AAA family ATPase [Muribaculaceae bacterium]|nr:AAA family ATPase [Muribaculaceae bacterium]
MKNIKIKINRLGAIRNSEIEVCPFLIFTGESGLGKSYAAFLAHYVFAILGGTRLTHYFDYLSSDSLPQTPQNGDVLLNVETQSLFSWINSDAIYYIGYMIGHQTFAGEIEIEWPIQKKEFVFRYQEEMIGIANKEEVISKISSENFTFNLYSADQTEMGRRNMYVNAFQSLIRAEISKAIFGEFLGFINEFILPPSRGALMELNERPPFMSGMYNEFFDFKINLFQPVKKATVPDLSLISLLQRLITGDIKQSGATFNYQTTDGVMMPLTAAASSVKELAPFILLISKYNLANTSILFEEPEAHLHPKRQNFMADLLGVALNQGCNLQITSHSDFFIRRLNLLVRLFSINNGSVEFSNLLNKYQIPFDSLIDPSKIKAYVLRKQDDGSSKIEEMDVSVKSGIPFESFNPAIIESLNIEDDINNFEERSNI